MSIVDSPEHRELARRAAVEGVVLLKNVARTLPFAATGMVGGGAVAGSKPLKIAVLGPNANRTLTLTSNYAG